MAAQKGRLWRISIFVNGSTNAYKLLGGMTDATLTIANEEVDITDKLSNGVKELLEGAGVTSFSISTSGPFKDSLAENEVMTAAFNNTFVKAKITSGNGDVYEAEEWHVASSERNGAHNNQEGKSLSLTCAGAITFTPNGGSPIARTITDPDA